MMTFTVSPERPKSIISFTLRIPEEMDTYLDDTKGRTSKADRAKALLELGASMEAATALGFFNLRPLVPFLTAQPCKTFCVKVLPLSDPQAHVVESRGC